VDRLDRLDLVLRLLRDRPGITAAELANELDTSPRSIFRDLARLRARGYPVESSRGRGGGLRLHPRWGLGRVQLATEEALGVLLSLAVAEGLSLPMFAANLSRARTRIVSAFPAAEQQRLRRLRERVMVGPPASAAVLASYGKENVAVTRVLQAGFVNDVMLEIEYRGSSGELSTRRVEPHALLLNWPAWYMLAHDHLRSEVRTFRLDRVTGARLSTDPFRPRPRAVVRAIGGADFADPDRWAL